MTARWVADRLKYFSRCNPEAPASLHDRASDNWAPLLAIAELADELEAAEQAAVEIEAASEDDDLAVQLIGDCKRAFEDLHAEALTSKRIIEHITVTGDGPWAENRYFTAFGIEIRAETSAPAEAEAAVVQSFFRRCLESVPVTVTPVTPVTARQMKGQKVRSDSTLSRV